MSATDPKRPRLKPGSRAYGLVETVAAATARLTRAITLDEIRLELAMLDMSAPQNLGAEISSLARRGVLEAIGARGRMRYALPGFVERAQAPGAASDASLILAALQAEAIERGRMVSTRQVQERLEAEGATLKSADPNAVRARLEGMSRPTKRASPRVRLVRAASPTGKMRSFWAPGEMQALEPPTHGITSRNEAIVQAVSDCTSELGRMPNGPEINAFLGAHRERNSYVKLIGEGDRPGGLTAAQDAAREGVLRMMTTPLTAHGGCQPRFALQGVEPAAEAAGLAMLDDYTYAYRLGQEGRSIKALRRSRRDAHGSSVIDPLLNAREGLLQTIASELVGEITPSLDALARTGARGDAILLDWRKEVRTSRYEQNSDRAIREVSAIRHEAIEVLKSVGPAGVAHPRVGQANTIPLRDLEVFLPRGAEAGERGPGHLIPRVRRFPDLTPEEGSPRFGTREGAVVDRAEAILEIAHLHGDRRTVLMLRRAYELLGEVLRDSSAVESSLDDLFARGPSPLASRLLLAAAMMGSGRVEGVAQAQLEAVRHGFGDENELKAACLAICVAAPAAAGEIVPRLIEPLSAGQHADTVRRIRMRVRRGSLLAIG